MKKLLTIVSASCIAMIVSCGPSAEEQAKIKQATEDSLNQVMEQARQDSMNMVMEQARQDSMASATAMMDSIKNKAVQDSIAAMSNKPKPKPKTKTIEQKKIEEVKKATQGRG
ncbi:MAG: hypothetical protein ABI772_13335 [Bacteroidota bacterium]